MLSARERERYEKTGELVVTGPAGDEYFVSLRSTTQNVHVRDEHGCRMESYCFGPRVTRAGEGMYLNFHVAQVLALKAGDDWKKVAVKARGYCQEDPSTVQRCDCGCGTILEDDDEPMAPRPRIGTWPAGQTFVVSNGDVVIRAFTLTAIREPPAAAVAPGDDGERGDTRLPV